MDEGTALRLALELVHSPWRVRFVRAEPLFPTGVPLLLRIAAGDGEAEAQAVALTERPPEVIREAAAFFIEQILLAPGGDSYRILGANADVSEAQLRRNMASLMSWVHPDHEGGREAFAARIASAWNDLKTPERRAAYDSAQRATNIARGHRHVRGRPRAARSPSTKPQTRPRADFAPKRAGRPRRGWLRRVLRALFGIKSRRSRY